MLPFRIFCRRFCSRNEALYAQMSKELASLNLKEILSDKIPEVRHAVTEFRKQRGTEIVSQVTLNDLYSGLRGCKLLICETSHLDPHEGIRFRELTIPEVQKLLPKADDGQQPLPEGLLWLLLTGEIPTRDQTKALSFDLAKRAKVPDFILSMIKHFPKEMHPMTQLSCAVGALNIESIFSKAYADGLPKTRQWEFIFEDALDLIAKIPVVAAAIYKNTFKDGFTSPEVALDKDWAKNFTNMIGFEDATFTELMRLYFTIHADHEGGNVSAHTTLLVGSTLSDPYRAWSAGLQGLAGPLHGLASQEVVLWLQKLMAEIGENPKEQQLKDFVIKTLKTGKVIPGYGHAVLRITDPRYVCQRKFALKHLPFDPMFKIVSQLYTVVPQILTSLGKVNNPWPNIDAHSGVLLQHFGLKEINYYTVLFGVARTIGAMSSLIWNRALNLPIERPKSVTTESLMKIAKFQLPSSYYQALQKEKQITY